MRVDVIDSKEALLELEANWNAVYDADPEAHLFLSWTWMSVWLPAIAKPWCVLAAAPDAESSDYVALFPLWLDTSERPAGGFYNAIQMGGSHNADYTGLLCRPDYEDRAIPAFAERIKAMNWAELRLELLRVSERRTALLLRAFPESGFVVSEIDRVGKDNIDNSRCPLVPLPGDWDTYLETRLSANMRQKIRRLLRQIETSDAFRITHADKETFERDLEILLRFWTDRWGPQKGARLEGIQKNNRLMLRHCFAAGQLFLPVFWHGERPVGALVFFVDARKRSFLFYMAGRDQTFDGPQSGLVLHAYSIRHAIRSGFTTYDFLRGNEPYKYSFGAEERRITSFVVATKDGQNLGGVLDRRSLPRVLRVSMEHQQAGRLDAADAGFRQVLEVQPHNTEALYGRGKILAKRGQHPAAVAAFRTLLAAKPGTARAWFWLGRSLRASGAFVPAALAYCDGIEREPAMAGAYQELGHILLTLGQFDQAVAAFDAARSLQATLPDIDSDLTKALQTRARLSPKELARRASQHTDVSDRVGKLAAIAAAGDRDRKGPQAKGSDRHHAG